jgi:hypothetical protein
MTDWIAEIAALLIPVLLRWRQELSTPGAPLGVSGLDVPDLDIEEAITGRIGLLNGRRGLRDLRLTLSGPRYPHAPPHPKRAAASYIPP